MPDRLPERMPVPVLGLELAARNRPGINTSPRPGIYPAAGSYPTPGAYPAPGAYPGPSVGHAVATRGRRALMLAVCCMSLFMVGLDNTIV